MRMTQLSKTGPTVSVIGFGGMPLSIAGRPSEQQAIDVIHASLNAGVRLIDTADVYCLDDSDLGHNERLVARALASWDGTGETVVVATKGGLTRPHGRWERAAHPRQLREACERSLTALNVDAIDLYQLHAPDPDLPFAESVGALADLKEAGKIRRIGLSNVSVDEIREAQECAEITSVQNRLNPFFREALTGGVVEYCAQHRIGFLPYSPVGGGRLNNKLPQHESLRPIAERMGVSTHAVVLAWVMSKGSHVIPIPGSSTIEHAVDAASASAVKLTKEDIQAIDQAEFSRA